MKKLVIIVLCMTIYGCVPIVQSTNDNSERSNSKKLVYDDYNYESNIETVQLYPKGNTLLPAVIKTNISSLHLSFDQLTENSDDYRVRIINCNKDWRPSGINSIQYLTDYNEFNIINYEFSFDTQAPYVHYTFDVPPVKRSGNYLLVVYRADNTEDIILSKRFMVVDTFVEISPAENLIGLSNLSSFNQQINFVINYSNYEIDNPLSNLNITIRQNQRDDNSITNLKPSFTREDIQQLEYRFFDHQNTFSAANEYRFFDLRSLIYPGQNVKSVDRTTTPPKTIIATDKPRTSLAYAQYNDNNGQYLISKHLDINGQYTNVTFNLDNDRINYRGEVYLFGEFSNWRTSDKYLMRYDSTNKIYSKEVLLKQGYYEYQYVIKSDSTPYYIEGNHSQTENSYEIFAYYKPYNEQSDLLIGYYTTRRNVSNY